MSIGFENITDEIIENISTESVVVSEDDEMMCIESSDPEPEPEPEPEPVILKKKKKKKSKRRKKKKKLKEFIEEKYEKY